MNKIKIAPSILAADILNLGSDVKRVEKAGCEYLHIDVMDGHFVPNMGFTADTVRALKKSTDMVLDVHLMIENPGKYIPDFIAAGADIITVHAEAVSDIRGVSEMVKREGVRFGVSVKPKTDVSVLCDYIDILDLILIMTVEPGFGGQSYMEEMEDKMRTARKMIDESGREIDLEVDGGINSVNIVRAVNAGADVLVAGSAIFRAESIEAVVGEMRAKTN